MNGIDNIARHRVWFIALGVALIALGIVAIATAILTTLISVVVFGWLLLIGGVIQSVHAFWVRPWSGLLLELLIGVLNIVVGLLIVANPGVGALGLTLLIAAFFIVGGLFRIIASADNPFPSRGWAIAGGLVNLLLGILIWAHWPATAFWVIGLFIGVDLIFTGWWFITLAFLTRKTITPAT
ncbi:MAG: acid-resistance rane protein [Pedosphaera sp.]|nr:acid-resistance rane protein [Pedosphaera sp.]